MKNLREYIDERLLINKHYKLHSIVVNDIEELKKIIDERYEKHPEHLYLTDIDVSRLTTLYYKNKNTNKIGLFYGMNKVKTIDVSGWNVSKVKSMDYMFYLCSELEDIIGIEDWDVSSMYSCKFMFAYCYKLNNIILPQSVYFYGRDVAISSQTFKNSGLAERYIK